MSTVVIRKRTSETRNNCIFYQSVAWYDSVVSYPACKRQLLCYCTKITLSNKLGRSNDGILFQMKNAKKNQFMQKYEIFIFNLRYLENARMIKGKKTTMRLNSIIVL